MRNRKKSPSPSDCVRPPLVQSGICIESKLTGNSNECIEMYDPVCGCDGINCENYCVAYSSGVSPYFSGLCCD